MANFQRYVNNVSLVLANSITPSATTIILTSNSNLPALAVGDWYTATLVTSDNTIFEIIKIIAVAGTSLTVVRGQEGTTAKTFSTSSLLELRITAGMLANSTSPYTDAVIDNEVSKIYTRIEPWDFMSEVQRNDVAGGHGSVDVSSAWQKCVDSVGNGMITPRPGVYLLNSGIQISDNTSFDGGAWGLTRIVAGAASFATNPLFKWNTGVSGSMFRNFVLQCGSMTDGQVFGLDGSNRITISDLQLSNPINLFNITHTNMVTLRDIWAVGLRGDYGIYWWGTPTTKSDVLNLSRFIVGCNANTVGTVGMIMDGFVHTLNADQTAFSTMGAGLIVRNTLGDISHTPSFIQWSKFQADFPLNEGISLSGNLIGADFTDVYVHASATKRNITIDQTVQAGSMKGGQVTGGFLEGIFNDSKYFVIEDIQVTGNGQTAAASGFTTGTLPGIRLGPNSIGGRVVGNYAGSWPGHTTSSQSAGVMIDSGASGYRVTANGVAGSLTASIIDNANTGEVFGNWRDDSQPWVIDPAGIVVRSGNFPLMAGTALSSVVLGDKVNGVAFEARTSGITANYAVTQSAITGQTPSFRAEGSDASISLAYVVKGSGAHRFTGNIFPTNDGSYSIGIGTLRFTNIFSNNITLNLPTSATPVNNGDLVLQGTSNTSLTFKVKGTDGVVRSGSITLS